MRCCAKSNRLATTAGWFVEQDIFPDPESMAAAAQNQIHNLAELRTALSSEGLLA